MVKSEQIYSPQNYLEAVLGKCFIINGDNDIDEIQAILDDYERSFWNYPLSEIDHIVENELDVVLVDCMVYNNKKKEYEQKQEHEDCTCFQLPTQEGVAWSVGT
mgnify:CR=1 FL=1